MEPKLGETVTCEGMLVEMRLYEGMWVYVVEAGAVWATLANSMTNVATDCRVNGTRAGLDPATAPAGL